MIVAVIIIPGFYSQTETAVSCNKKAGTGIENIFFVTGIQNLFALPEILSIPQGCNTEKDIFYPSTGLFIARDSRFCLAVKAGDNDDSHNHNDTGSFTIYKDGKPLFADIGVETYQAKTFSPQRYEI